MNRRDLLKYSIAAPLVGCVSSNEVSSYTKKPVDNKRAPRDTDGREYDQWLDMQYGYEMLGKDEMHL